MSKSNIEIMKKIIEEKKKKSSEQGSIGRPDKGKSVSRKAFKNKKSGGVFDK
jgi:hypothetical protein